MLPHLTFYAKILYLLMVVVAGALCDRNQIYLYSKCASRYVGMTPDGKLLAYDNTGIDCPHEIITISLHVDSFSFDVGSENQFFKLTLFLEKNQTYLCFTKKWRLVTMKNLHESCYFYETLENGWFRYRSAMNDKIFLGFTKNGKPVRHKAPHINTDCYNFQKEEVVQNETKSHKMQTNRRKKEMARRMQDHRPTGRRRHGPQTKRFSYSNVQETEPNANCTHDDIVKKPKATPKKVTNSNSGLLPKFRHAQHAQRRIIKKVDKIL
ncbi:uncharacterized protein LOC119085216 [Bradysia coprophila]|uniref:uncharacterized protein LOC119085216 n=1 Tax=Bradysia coprophila TaxID=38358 RepID=UPI00187DB29D|nr:uncharacterized protein LOC119085216 [Bradysia coprophila]